MAPERMYVSIDAGQYQRWADAYIKPAKCGHAGCASYVLESPCDTLAIIGTYDEVLEFLVGAAQKLAALRLTVTEASKFGKDTQ